jgi:hypothetical protein
LFWRQLRFGRNWLHIIFRTIVLEAAQIWREMAPHYFPKDCFGGSSNLEGNGSTLLSADCFGNVEGTGSTLFSGGLFWRQLRFGRNWLHIIFHQIVLEAAQIWRELAPHYFLTDCFGGSSHYFQTDFFVGSSNLEGTGFLLFFGGFFWKFGGNWLHIIFW